jgi:hypothetical protein
MATTKKARKSPAKSKAPAWRKDRITSEVDGDTGRRVVDLPTIPGLSNPIRDEVFAFEAGLLGTVKAVIRMNKRLAGTLDTPITHKMAAAVAALEEGSALEQFYA